MTFCQEIKAPLQQHKQTIGKSNEKVNMHDCPDLPRCETRKPLKRKSATRRSADDREIALIQYRRVPVVHDPPHGPNDIRNVLTSCVRQA